MRDFYLTESRAALHDRLSKIVAQNDASAKRVAEPLRLMTPTVFETRLQEELERFRDSIDLHKQVSASLAVPPAVEAATRAAADVERQLGGLPQLNAIRALVHEAERQRQWLGTIVGKAERMRDVQREFAELGARLAVHVAPTFTAVRIFEAAFQRRDAWYEQARLANLFNQTLDYHRALAQLATPHGLQFPSWPIEEANRAVQAFAVVSGSQLVPDDFDIDTGSAPTSQELEVRLSLLAPGLVTPLRGAIDSLRSKNPDRVRHVGASLRTLGDNLLTALAPDDTLDRFFDDPEEYKEGGQYTRRARLTYVFYDLNDGGYSRIAGQDIDLMLATFYPENAAIHTLAPSLTDREMEVLVRRVEGCISVVLAAAGY